MNYRYLSFMPKTEQAPFPYQGKGWGWVRILWHYITANFKNQ